MLLLKNCRSTFFVVDVSLLKLIAIKQDFKNSSKNTIFVQEKQSKVGINQAMKIVSQLILRKSGMSGVLLI